MSAFHLPNKNLFQKFTVYGAKTVLGRRGKLDECIEVIMSGYVLYTTPKLLINTWNKSRQSILARDVGPIRFHGGPPGARKLYKGSLLTLVLDASFTSRVEARHGSNL